MVEMSKENDLALNKGVSTRSQVINRWIFLLLTTQIMVFFSEKVYWYIQGYSLTELVLYYIFGVYLLFWTISHFKVNHIWPLVLASVTYPLYVEGLFTGIITFDITLFTMISYFIGWHSTLAVLIGWFYHRKCLVKGNRSGLILSSSLLGILWGLWSIIYWSPAQINDPDFEKEGFEVGQWPISEFASLAAYLTVIYILSHFFLSKGSIWQTEFKPTRVENYFVLVVMTAFFVFQILLAGIFVILLIIHFLIVFYTLNKYKNRRSDEKTILLSLVGHIRVRDLLIFSLMPIFAISIYALFFYINPSVWFIDNILYLGIVSIQVIYGFILYVQSIRKSIKWTPPNMEAKTSDIMS